LPLVLMYFEVPRNFQNTHLFGPQAVERVIEGRQMESSLHEVASKHLPPFITPPGETDWLLVAMAVVLVLAVLGIGVFFFWLHSLPERMVHHKVQFDLVAVLALLSLFTHIHAFWVAALILALIDLPKISLSDYLHVMQRMAGSLEKLAGESSRDAEQLPTAPKPAIETRPHLTKDEAEKAVAMERAAKREPSHA
jgi:hypothetical protein